MFSFPYIAQLRAPPKQGKPQHNTQKSTQLRY
jgi:hypothetical protein